MKKILILGGTGFVGRSLCERLVGDEGSASLRLTVPTRRLAHGKAVQLLPLVDLVQADVHDDAQLDRLLDGCDAVVNLIAILHGSEAAFEATHVRLPARLAAACQRMGVRRVVHVSALGVSAEAPSRYLRSKARGEDALQGAGLELTLLRPSVIFGAEDQFLNLFARIQGLAPVLPLAGADAQFQPVWVGDVAAAIAHCLSDRTTIGHTYECAGPEVKTLAELVRLAGEAAGHARPILPLPAPLAWLQALAMECLPGEPLMSRDNLASMQTANVASGKLPGLAELGIAATPLSAIVPGYLSAHQRCGRLDAWRARHR
ncbi:complex I NDUFA9 subunit family protein [Ideonella sp.]|uniref:complex I NDUFA9 subunit family protein n=1 Tax=Ideonella sp. TaxID=1929293 RepID=UPI003BB7517E